MVQALIKVNEHSGDSGKVLAFFRRFTGIDDQSGKRNPDRPAVVSTRFQAFFSRCGIIRRGAGFRLDAGLLPWRQAGLFRNVSDELALA